MSVKVTFVASLNANLEVGTAAVEVAVSVFALGGRAVLIHPLSASPSSPTVMGIRRMVGVVNLDAVARFVTVGQMYGVHLIGCRAGGAGALIPVGVCVNEVG